MVSVLRPGVDLNRHEASSAAGSVWHFLLPVRVIFTFHAPAFLHYILEAVASQDAQCTARKCCEEQQKGSNARMKNAGPSLLV